MKYQTRIQVIEAMQLTKDNRKQVIELVQRGAGVVIDKPWDQINLWLAPESVGLETLARDQILRQGDYIIYHGHNHFQIMARDAFEMQYEPFKNTLSFKEIPGASTQKAS